MNSARRMNHNGSSSLVNNLTQVSDGQDRIQVSFPKNVEKVAEKKKKGENKQKERK